MKFGELLARELVEYGEPYASLIDISVLKDLDTVYEANSHDEGVADEYR